MRCKKLFWLVAAVAVVSVVGTRSTLAVPYHWGPGQITELGQRDGCISWRCRAAEHD